MPLTGDHFQKLHDAILSAFSGADLEQLLRFDLNTRLDNIVPKAPMSEIVFRLIEWAEQRGRTEELVRALQRARPHNKEIQAVTQSFVSPPRAPAKRPGKVRPDGAFRAWLRETLIDQFPTRSALAMLVDDSLSVNLEAVSRASNLTETVFELIQWASIDPQGQLRPLLDAAIERRPHSDELKALKAELFGE
jgi:hypothetical protein